MTENPRDKYANRFDTGENSEQGETQDATSETTSEEKTAQDDENAQNEWNEGNVKKDWNGWTVYLPDKLDSAFEDEYNRLQYLLDRDIKKDRHYKPLMVALALDRLEEMDADDLNAFLERMERRELGAFKE